MASSRPGQNQSDETPSRVGLDHVALGTLRPVSIGLALLYVVFATVHPLVLPPAAAWLMSPAAALTALILLGLFVLLRRGWMPARWAHAAGAGIAALVLGNSLLHLAVTGDLRQTTNLVLLIVGAGSLLLSTRWLVVVIASTLVSWAVVLAEASLIIEPAPAVLHFGVALLSGTVLSALAHTVRVSTLRRVQRLRIRDEKRKGELKAVLVAARESERRYRDLLQNANDLVQSVTPDGSILYTNRAWRKTLGYGRDRLKDLSIFDVIHPDSEARYRAILRRLTTEPGSERAQLTFVTEDGEAIIVEGNINCRFDGGKPVATRGIFRDVTERVRAERALQRQNRRLRARHTVATALADSMELHELVDQALSSTIQALGFSAGLIVLADDDGRLKLFSQNGLPSSFHTSLESNEFEDTPCDWVYREGKPLHLEDLHQARPAHERPVDLRELRRLGFRAYAGAPIVHKDLALGTFCLFDRRPRTLSAGEETLLSGIGQQIGVAVENARLFEQSRRRRLYLEALLSAAPDAIITLDAEHRIVEWNQGAESLFGYTSEEAVGEHLDPLIAAGKLDEATKLTKTVMRGAKLTSVESVRYRKDGSPVDVLLAGSPILIEGEFAGAVAVYTDISELKEAQEALRDYAEELETRNEELDAFAHTVAHDLKNPLQHLVGYADLLLDDYQKLPDQSRREALSTIAETAERMDNIIDELLLLAEVRRGEVETEPLDMASLVAAAQRRLGYLIEAHDAEIVTPEMWPAAQGHGPWVEEVWINYLSNAIKYGGDSPRVELGATPRPDGTVRFWVRDSGHGLSEEEQAQLFTPFSRLHQVKAEGHGLGLSIVRRIVDKLGGDVGVESEPGEGTTFTFTLPRLGDPAAERPTSRAAASKPHS